MAELSSVFGLAETDHISTPSWSSVVSVIIVVPIEK